MKVKELIEKLKEFDPDTLVMVEGYEGGLDTPKTIYSAPVVLNANFEWYYGKHEEYRERKHSPHRPDCMAVIIPRE